jgi:hypothetical protein
MDDVTFLRGAAYRANGFTDLEVSMKKLITAAAISGVAVALGGGALASAGATTVQQQHSSGTIATGSTVCVGPLAPSSADGVQIFGFTNANASLTWQVFSVSSQTAPTLVFSTTARSVSQAIKPVGNLLYQACVVKRSGAAQDYDLTLNSQPLG